MGSELGSPSEGIGSMPSPIQAPRPKRRHGVLATIALGAALAFVVLCVLYGPNQAATLLAFSVICTAGLGLIPIVFLSWVVGWVVFAVWDATRKPSPAAPVP